MHASMYKWNDATRRSLITINGDWMCFIVCNDIRLNHWNEIRFIYFAVDKEIFICSIVNGSVEIPGLNTNPAISLNFDFREYSHF